MKRQEILEMAKKCVCEDRNQSYGEPEDNFSRIARLWSEYLQYVISPVDVANMMVLFKVARVQRESGCGTGFNMDNFIDIAGYAACGGEIAAALWNGRNECLPQQGQDLGEQK